MSAVAVLVFACNGKTVDPNAPATHCTPACTGANVCGLGYQYTGSQCSGTPPVDCVTPFDASVTQCPPCILAANCNSNSSCSADDCNCILKTKCFNETHGGGCIQTQSGLDYFCYPN